MSFNRWGSIVDGVDPVNTTDTKISEIRSDGVSIYPDIPDSGVARWEFEQDVTDSWGSNDLTDDTNGVFTTNEQFGSYAKSFDGTDDELRASSFGDFAPFSISTWFKLATGGRQTIVSWTAGFGSTFTVQISVNGSGPATIVGRAYDGSNINAISYDATISGSWTHAVLTLDSNDNGELYVNGSSRATGHLPTQSKSDLAIGSDATGSGDYAEGDVDHTDVYDKILSGSEVSDLYNTGHI